MPEINKELEMYKKEGANLLMPSTHYVEGLSKFHAVVVDAVRLDPDPDMGDVYDPRDDGKFLRDKAGVLNPLKKVRLSKQGLNKLTNTAGIIWSPSQSHPITDRSNRNYVAFRAVGGIRKPDGQPLFYAATYDLDLELEEEKLRDKYESQADNTIPNTNPPRLWRGDKSHAEYVEYCVKRDMFQKRSNALKLCESGAKNRVIREVLGLKNAYTIAELQKPFVMARIVFQPDYNDKEVRNRLLDAHIAAMTGIYGLPQPPIAGFAPQEIQETEPIDVVATEEDKANGNGNGAPPEPPDPDPLESQVTDFHNSSNADQLMTITKLSFKKAYDLAGFQTKSKKNIGEMSPAKLEGLFRHLISLPDPTAQEDFDVPFEMGG
jgi:hypothetical protein